MQFDGNQIMKKAYREDNENEPAQPWAYIGKSMDR